MTTLREAAQQALEYMKSVGKMDMHPEEWAIVERLEAALAEPRPIQECYGDCPTNPQTCPNPCNFEGRPRPVQEPVAWQWLDTAHFRKKIPAGATPSEWTPLYTAPPQRKPLMEEEIMQCFDEAVADYVDVSDAEMVDFARAIERAHNIT